MVPNNHMRKDWQRYIKTHFDQPMKRKARAMLRRRKAASKAPRPLEKLRPIVNCPTQRYNMRLRAGRGFSLLECKKVGLHPHFARTIGIAVDPRRRNKSQEGMGRNVHRLKQYMERLVLFPKPPSGKERRNKEKMIAYFTSVARAKSRLTQYKRFVRTPMKFQPKKTEVPVVKVSEVPQYDVYATLKNEWCIMHHHFKWRRANLRKAKARYAEAKKAEKKAQAN